MQRPTLILAMLTLAQCLCGDPLAAEPVAGRFTDCDGCPEMVTVPAGAFTMGSPENEKGRNSWEGPQRTVTFARPFAVGRFEVTRGQFAAFVQAARYTVSQGCWTTEDGRTDYRGDRSWRGPAFAQDDLHPAVCLNGRDIKAYVDWLAKKTGKGYRLISEAEWEYAARATTTPGPAPRFGFGDDEDALCAHANGLDQSAKSVLRKFETDHQSNNRPDKC